MRPGLQQEHDAIVVQIERLLGAAERGDGAPSLERLEETLTSGYAHALALDAERLRLERRLASMTIAVADGAVDAGAELAEVRRCLESAQDALGRLRAQLVDLRVRATAVRGGVPHART